MNFVRWTDEVGNDTILQLDEVSHLQHFIHKTGVDDSARWMIVTAYLKNGTQIQFTKATEPGTPVPEAVLLAIFQKLQKLWLDTLDDLGNNCLVHEI